MGTLAEKLQYTYDAVNDIQAAINEKKVECPDSVPLSGYGDKIRDIKTEQKPTFCPWYDLGKVYYGFDESTILFEKKFEKLDKTDIYIVENTYNN